MQKACRNIRDIEAHKKFSVSQYLNEAIERENDNAKNNKIEHKDWRHQTHRKKEPSCPHEAACMSLAC